MKHLRLALSLLLISTAAFAQKPLRIALVEDSTGPLEAYAKQSRTGFMWGLD